MPKLRKKSSKESADKARAQRLWDSYRLTVKDWDKILEFQDGVCFLCGKVQNSGKRLATDHCHKTGLVRGLLCSQCNRILGRIERGGWTLLIIKKLLMYLLNPPVTKALGREILGYAGRAGTKKHRKLVQKERKLLKAAALEATKRCN